MDNKLFYFLAANDEYANDMSDGAWMQFLQDSVERYNEMNGTKYDPYKSVMEYLKLESVKNQL